MHGIVIANPNMLVVRLEDGMYSVVEPMGGYNIEIGDELVGDLETEGSTVLMNITYDEEIDAIIQYVAGNPQDAFRILPAH